MRFTFLEVWAYSPFWCVPQSFRHERWAVYQSILLLTYSQALPSRGYIREFSSALGAYKVPLPRMQLLRQFCLHTLTWSFLFLQVLGQNSVQTFGWRFRTDVSRSLPLPLQCVFWVIPSLCLWICHHVSTSVLSSSQIHRTQPLGTTLVLLLTIWWPSQRAVNHLRHSSESATTPFLGFLSIQSVERYSQSFLWMKAHVYCGRYETDIADSRFAGKYWRYRKFDIRGSSEWVTIFFQKGTAELMLIKAVDFTNCIVPAPSQDFRISSNITEGGTLETCRPWRLDIDGGHPPYTVVLDARNSPVMTNITIPSTDNAMVYINRATPGTDLFGK